MKKYLLILLAIIAISPVFVSAEPAADAPVKLDYSGFVKCDGVVTEEKNKDGTLKEPYRQTKCDFNALLLTIKLGINWLFIITIPVATVALAYGGLMYMTGDPGKIGTARKIFSSIATGFIIMAVAWFAVITVVNWFISVENKSVINTFVNTVN